jgi:hypothetical protein
VIPPARLGWALVAIVVAGTVAAIMFQAPAVRTDAAYGLLAAMQHKAGRSPSILTLREADPGDLRRDLARRVSQWAPAYQAVPYAFHELGLSWANAVRATVLLAWAAGVSGWGLYFLAVLGPGPRLPWLLAVFLLLRPSHDAAYAYRGGEALEWGTFPGVILVNLWAMTRQAASSQLPLAALGGALAAGLFLVRHGAAIPGAGIGTAWALGALAGRLPRSSAGAWGLGAAIVAGGILGAGFPGGRTVLEKLHDPPSWAFAWPVVTWPLALTDLDGLLHWLFLRPGRAVFRDESPLLAFGLAALALLALACRTAGTATRERPGDSLRSAAAQTASIVLGVTIVLLAALHARGTAISFEGRHVRIAVLLLLPFVFERVVAASGAGQPARRGLGLVACLLFLLVPAVYGIGSLVDKAALRHARSHAATGPQGIRLDFLGQGVNARALYSELRAKVVGAETLLLVTHPEAAFALADRRLLVLQVEGLPLEFLRTLAYHGRPAGGIVLVLPRALDRDGRRQALQAAFVDVHQWFDVPLETTPVWTLWFGR